MGILSKISAVLVLALATRASANDIEKDYSKETTKRATSALREAYEVPFGWTCDPELYFLEDICVCECGVLSAGCGYNIPVQGCSEPGQLCNYEAICIDIPEEWACNPYYFNVSDGCDCECGAVDPDCSLPDQTLYGCQAFQQCNATGFCVDSPPTLQPTPAGLPAEWTCRFVFYNAGDGCDCECGAPDPDCDIAGATLFGCDSDALGCVAGVCTYPDDPTPRPSFAPITSFPTVPGPSGLQTNAAGIVVGVAVAAMLAGVGVGALVYVLLTK